MIAIKKIVKDKKISTLYQPIYKINNMEILGYEALSRGPNGFYYSPQKLFNSALENDCLEELELLCAYKALENYPIEKPLFINFTATTAARHCIEISRNFKGTIIEITEAGGEYKKNFLKAVNYLTKNGVHIALDDIGNGSKDFYRICELPASYFKIDKELIQGMTSFLNSEYYKAVIYYMTKLAEEKGIRIIAEGVETLNRLKEVKKAGIELAQGFYFAYPCTPDDFQ